MVFTSQNISGRNIKKHNIKLNGSFKNMLHLFRKLFCVHIYEYEQMEEIGSHKECRKCGVTK
ncbi:hypothetical protein B9T33_05820 [Acinetobacter sp. ANC 5054]|nr:hypothetical protein B9T33_05820 [Acinetobacter sp. ANC 5054]